MANTITLTDIAPARVFAGDRASPAVPVSGTYTVTGSPPAIQAQVIDAGDIYALADVYAPSDIYNVGTTVVVAWTTIVASPTGGNYSGTIVVPIHSNMLQLQVRFADLSAQANGTNLWGVGYIVGAIGQSNMSNMWSGVFAWNPQAPDARASYYVVQPVAPGWIAAGSNFDNGDGMIAMVNALCNRFNAPVGVILGAVGGTALDQAAANPLAPLTYWTHLGGVSTNWPLDYVYQAFADAVVATGADISTTIWLQGEQEASSNFSNFPAYLLDLQALYARILALCPSRTTANLFFHIGVIGFASYGSAVIDGLRNAMITQGLSGNGFQLGPCTYDLPMLAEPGSATQHHIPPGYVTLGHRWAAQVSYWMGTPGSFFPTPGTSPRVTSATRNGRFLLLNVQMPPVGSSPILAGLVSGNTTGFSFSTSSGTPLTPSVGPVPVSLTQIAVAFATDPAAQVQVEYQAGQPASFFPIPSLANYVVGGNNVLGELTPQPLMHIGGPGAGLIVTEDIANFFGVPLFPALIGLGWSVERTAIWSTNVQENISGKQVATGYWSGPKYRWKLKFDFLRYNLPNTGPEFYALLAFFNGVQGRRTPWLFQDVDDFQASNQLVDLGDGSTTQFHLTRVMGTSQGEPETILAPNFDTTPPGGTIVAGVTVNGAPAAAQYTKYGSTNPGLLVFSVPPPFAAVIAATFYFYWPVRFDDDSMTLSKFMQNLASADGVTFTSVKN